MDHVKIDINLDANDITGDALVILKTIRPTWEQTNIKFKFFNEGISNKTVGCYVDDRFEGDIVLVRIYGPSTNYFVDRERELRYIGYLSQQGLCPPLYAVCNNGRAYAYCHGVTLDNVKFKTYRKQIIKEMVRLHSLKPPFMKENQESEFFPKVKNWIDMVPASYDDSSQNERWQREGPSLSGLKKEYKIVKNIVETTDSRIVLCHNDLLWSNIIYNETSDKVTFIDHEFTMFNHQYFEIGDHFAEYVGTEDMDVSRYPDKEYLLEWCRIYLEEWNTHNKITSGISDDDVYHLYSQANKFALVANFSWAIWAFKMASHPDIDFDYLGYGLTRLKQYFDRKEEFLAL